jgi:hypothetical protein
MEIKDVFEAGYKLYTNKTAGFILEKLLDKNPDIRQKALNNVRSAFALPYYLRKLRNSGIDYTAFVAEKDIYEFKVALTEAVVQAEKLDDRIASLFVEREVDPSISLLEVPTIDAKGIVITDITNSNTIKFSNISGSTAQIKMIELGTGIETKIDVLRNRNYTAFLDILNTHRVKLFNAKYKYIANLLKEVAEQRALNGEEIAYQSGSTTLEKDINTINQTIDIIRLENEDIIGQINRIVFLVPMATNLKHRIRTAIQTFAPIPNLTASTFSGNVEVEVIDTNKIDFPDNNTAYAVVPQEWNRLYLAINDDMAQTINNQNFTISIGMRIKFGAGILNNKQVIKVKFA